MKDKEQISFLKQFFESMNEIVYMVDMDTHTMYYMNRKARQSFGIAEDAALEGKQCHELLQCRASSCPFCNNPMLQSGEFVEWIFYHPVLNRHFATKTTMLTDGRRRIRLEIAVDLDSENRQVYAVREYESNVKLFNEALCKAMSYYDSKEDPIQVFLSHIGSRLGGKRMCIFEGVEGGNVKNTYEWCAPQVQPLMHTLQEVPWTTVETWYHAFRRGEHVILSNVEETREQNPALYQMLKRQKIHSLIVCPIASNGEILGFFGMDNPSLHNLYEVSSLLEIMSHFILCMFQRRSFLQRLERNSYYDELTGALNRHGLSWTLEQMHREESLGVIYCDVMGLKQINDTQGHQQGDELLCRAHTFLMIQGEGQPVYRMGGDEFMVLCRNVDRQEFARLVRRVCDQSGPNHVDMAVGYAWCEQLGDNFHTLLSRADQQMYVDKYQRRQSQLCP